MQLGESDEDSFKALKRSLSAAFTVGIIILLLFVAFVVFSATQIQFHVGNASYFINGQNFVISVPINISNNGPFDLQNLQINSTVFEGKVELLNSTTLVSRIEHNSETAFTHNLTVNIPVFIEDHQDLLFNDTELRAAERIRVVLASLLPVGIEFNNTYSWGAPLNGFSVSNLQFQPINFTTAQVSLDVAFNNHATFPLEGNITINAFSGTRQIMTQNLRLNVSSGGRFSSPIQLLLPTIVPVTRVSIVVQTSYFSWEEDVYG
jgi:hypothetical protein